MTCLITTMNRKSWEDFCKFSLRANDPYWRVSVEKEKRYFNVRVVGLEISLSW